MNTNRITEIDVTESINVNESNKGNSTTEHSEVTAESLNGVINGNVFEESSEPEEDKKPKKKVPRRVLHFSDGVIEEYSTDEDQDEPDVVKKRTINDVMAVDPKTLTWGSWFWFQTTFVGSKTLEVCDYLGENLATFFGITTPKYQYEMDFYNTMKAEEEEQKKQQDLEMGGWVDATENVGDLKSENSNQRSPVISRVYFAGSPFTTTNNQDVGTAV